MNPPKSRTEPGSKGRRSHPPRRSCLTVLVLVSLWGTMEARAVTRLPKPEYKPESRIRFPDMIFGLSWSPDERTVAVVHGSTGSARVALVDPRGSFKNITPAFQGVPSAQFGDASTLFVTAPKGRVYRYRLPSGSLQWQRNIQPGSRIAATGPGKVVLHSKSGLMVLDAKSGVLLGHLRDSAGAARPINPAIWVGKADIFAVDFEKHRILIWSQGSTKPRVQKLWLCRKPIFQAAYSANGRRLAVLCLRNDNKRGILGMFGVLPSGAVIQSSVWYMGALAARRALNLSVDDGSNTGMVAGLAGGGALLLQKGLLTPLPTRNAAPTLADLSRKGNRLALTDGRTITIMCKSCRPRSPGRGTARQAGSHRRPRPSRAASRQKRPVPFLGGQRYIKAHANRAYALALTQQALVTSGGDGTLGFFDRWTGRLLHRAGRKSIVHTEWVESSADGSKLVAGWGSGRLSIHDAKTGRVLLTWPGHPDSVFEAHFSRDGKRILSCGQDGFLRIWDARTGANLAILAQPKQGRRPPRWETFAPSSINTTAFHPTKPWVAMGTPDGLLAWVDERTGRVMAQRTLAGDAVMALMPGLDNDSLVLATTRNICSWKGRTAQAPSCIRTRGSNVGITWIDKGRIVAVGNADPIPGVLIVDIESMKVSRHLHATPMNKTRPVDVGRAYPVFDLAFDPNLRLLHGTLHSGWVVTWRLEP